MQQLPAPARPKLRRLARRLTLGLFLDRWPAWAAASLIAAGTIALLCRLFFPRASAWLPWLWIAPALVAIPAAIIAWRRAFTPAQLVAVADWLAGGDGSVMTASERPHTVWASRAADRVATLTLPRWRPWRSLRWLPPAAAFLLAALLLPQRTPAATDTALADEIAADLTTALDALKEEALVTPQEEARIEEEIERLRRDAERRVDPGTWEAADALREQMSASVAAKQDALKWAQDAANRLAAAAESGAGSAQASALTSELAAALDKLAKSGGLTGAAADLKQMLGAGNLPGGAAEWAKFAAELGADAGELGQLAEAMGEGRGRGGRFNPGDFPLSGGAGGDGGRTPGRGGINRGRADAELTWGKETQPHDRFKAQTLPPGAPRSPDDWAPVVVLPGAPQESARMSTAAATRNYAADPGNAAWRRSLAPRHQAAVKKYFEK